MRVVEIFPHPKWSGKVTDGFDMALAKLEREVENATLPYLPHENRTFEHNKVVWALGFGVCDDHPQAADSIEMMKKLTIIDHQHCPGEVKKHLKTDMLCAYSPDQLICNGKAIFMGDKCLFDFILDVVMSLCLPPHPQIAALLISE